MNPSEFTRRRRAAKRRQADPNTPIREDYRAILRSARLLARDWPLSVRRSRSRPQQATGRCYPDRIVVTLGLGVDQARWRALLLHEVAHALTPKDPGHGDEWRSVFVELARRAYGITVECHADSSHNLQDAVEAALQPQES